MRLFHKKQDGFNLPYSFEKDTPLMWWSTNYTGFNSIGKLAIKLFSIMPHSVIVKESSCHWAMAQIRSFYIANLKKELLFFGKTLSLDNLQEQMTSATFLAEDDESITEDSKIEEAEYNNLEIVEHFDVENIVFLSDEIFQDGEFDTNSEELQDIDDEFGESSDNESVVSNKVGRGVFNFNPTNLAAELMREWHHEDNSG
ncbi:12410_t:CDS:2 [Gigaspora margarita]|uniref:12410_t:CDS:1 n=1 Tax=Gigaspora margarita TaxID=4874 RepID=A0ABN7UWT7_GIGMA|nr:12410_t:CDS:2 [Gigaspora margarita]